MSSNREFMAAHLARKARATAAEALPAIALDGVSPAPRLLPRVDIAAAVVVVVTGLPEDILERLIPRDWRFERDYRTLDGKVYFNRASLCLLVGVLSTSGEPVAAGKLMKFLTEQEDAEAPRRGLATLKTAVDDMKLASETASIRIEMKPLAAQDKKGWAQDWEERHP